MAKQIARSTEDQGHSLELDKLQWGRLEDWGQLVRLPAAFTLISNVLVAAILSGQGFVPITALLPTLLASLAAYWAGMILNDVVDLEEDRRSRPDRPLASGRISPTIAGHVGTALLLLSPLLILGVTSLHQSQPLWQGAAFAASVALSLSVRAYNSFLKSTPLGALLMGTCRALNVLMVGVTMLSVSDASQFPVALLYFAGAIGLYILGVTVFAGREEAGDSDSALLLFGLVLQVAALAVLGNLPRFETREVAWTLNPGGGYPLLMGLIAMTVIHRCLKALLHPVSRKVQLAVKHSLLTLILIDAGVALMWAGPIYGCLVVAFLVPALFSAIRMRTT